MIGPRTIRRVRKIEQPTTTQTSRVSGKKMIGEKTICNGRGFAECMRPPRMNTRPATVAPSRIVSCPRKLEHRRYRAGEEYIAGKDTYASVGMPGHLDGTQKASSVAKRLIFCDDSVPAEMDGTRWGTARQHQGAKNKTPWKHVSSFL
jgi:hypothetical protein